MNNFLKRKDGQVQIGIGVLAAGAFLIGAMTFAVNAYLKSGEAITQVSEVRGDIKAINVKLENIKEILDMWKQQMIRDGKLSKDGLPK